MKTALAAATIVLAIGLASPDAGAKRFGGGGNFGKQRPTPTATQPAKQAPAAAPATTPAAPASAAKAAIPPPKPSFMQRWGGMLAGLGIGVLLASMFGAQMGPIVGMILAGLAIAAIGLFLLRLFAGRGARAPSTPLAVPAVGSLLAEEAPAPSAVASAPAVAIAAAAAGLSDAEVQPFLRVAKTSFIRLQAANDARNLDDIRDYTTPEVFAEIAMQLQERDDAPQKTEVVSLDAQLVENVVEGDYALASVRFSGLIRENDANHPAPFEETWNVRKSLKERNASWLISGIQQAA